MEVKLGNENFEEEVIKSETPVLVDFWATWCGPCRMIAPELEKLGEETEGKLKIGKVNVDEQPALAAKFKIEAIPTLILFEKGEAVKKFVGYSTAKELKEKIGL